MFDTVLDEAAPADLAEPWPSPPMLSASELAPGPDGAPPRCSAAQTQPSGWLALELDEATTVSSRLPDAELVEAIVGLDRITSWAGARQARLLAEFGRRRPGEDPQAIHCDRPAITSRFAPDEIGLALHLSRGTAMGRLGQATQLGRQLPATLDAWEHGLLDDRKVRAICDTTVFLPTEQATAVQDRVLGRAPTQTLAQLRAALARAVLAVDPDGAAQRHRQARTQRRVTIGQDNDGMASLWALLPATDATSAYEWLTRLARGLGANDLRNMDARRADLLVELLTGHLTYAPASPEDTIHPAGTADPADRPGPADQPTPVTQVEATDAARTADSGDHAAGPAHRTVPTGQARTAGHIGTTEQADAPGEADTTSAPGEADTTSAPGEVDTTGTGAGAGTPDPQRRTALPPGLPRPATPGKPLVQIVMPFSTLTGADDRPCELVGYGPIPADLARQIAADAVWKRLLTDPASGALLDHGRTTYHPPVALAQFVRARDVVCRFPTCRRRAANCELDHIRPYPDGPTSEANLAGHCLHHHHTKHSPGWQVIAHPDRRLEWITPTGHRYHSEPHDYRPEPPLPQPPPPQPPASPRPDQPPARTPRLNRHAELIGHDPTTTDTDPPPF